MPYSDVYGTCIIRKSSYWQVKFSIVISAADQLGSLAYICHYCEKITKMEFIFAYVEKYPYICLKRKKEIL